MNESTIELPVNIQELVGFLGKFAKKDLEELQKKFPSEATHLDPEGILDHENISPILTVETCLIAMSRTINLCKDKREVIEDRLKLVNNLQNVGTIFSIVASASIFGLLKKEYIEATYVAAAIAFLGSLLPKISSLLANTPTQQSFAEIHGKLNKLEIEAEQIYEMLDIRKRSRAYDGSQSLVNRGNDIAKQIKQLLLSSVI